MKVPKSEYRWLEVIGLRLFNQCHGSDVNRFFVDFVEAARKGTEEIIGLYLYSSVSIDSDWEIHIYRKKKKEFPKKTGLGLRIAMELSTFGLVHHAVWCCRGSSENMIIQCQER